MWKFLIFWLALSAVVQNGYTAVNERNSRKISANEKMESFVAKVGKTGYSAEEHEVITEDGYVLLLHRMSNGLVPSITGTKPAVILMHGLLASSDMWVMRGPDEDLSYLLTDAGYDVWILNVRGNTHSRRHTKLSPKQREFWRFSWHESGAYDMPAVIDHILALTGLRKLSLIGHSMGTIMSYVLLSIRPEYNERVNICVSLAPVAIFKHRPSGIFWETIILNGNDFLNSFRRIGMYEFLARHDFTTRLLNWVCRLQDYAQFCTEVAYLLSGYPDNKQYKTSFVPMLVQNFPQGTSLDTMGHLRQLVINGNFSQYDYGSVENQARYGQKTASEYPLNRITAPVKLYQGLNDIFTSPSGVRALEEKLPNVIASKTVADPKFNHLDFILSKDAKELLYDDIITVLNKYSWYC